MAENQIPISYVISASAVLPGATLEPLQLSTILLLTDEQPINELSEAYSIYRTASGVASDYGTNSKVARLATNIFAQSPNILANNGYVIVAPMLGNIPQEVIPASAGTVTTTSILENVGNFSLINNGVLNITVDGEAKQVTDLDFTQAQSLGEIAQILDGSIEGVTVTATEQTLIFTSDTTGANSNVSIQAMSGAEGTDLFGVNYLNGAQAVVVAGSDEVTIAEHAETMSEAIIRISNLIYFNGIICAKAYTDIEASEASNTVQSMQDRILMLASNDVNSVKSGGVFYQLRGNFYTKCLLYTMGTSFEATLFAAAYVSRGMAVNYNGSNTTLTMNLKDLANVQADTGISETILNLCSTAGVDCYPSIAGLAKVISNKYRFFFDQVQNQIWLVNTVQRAVFNGLATTTTKIPQTEAGMVLFESPIYGVVAQAVNNGMAAPGTWTSPDTFGNLEDFHRNIREFGYYIYHTPVSEQLTAVREARIAPVVQIAVKEAGAIHSGNILIYINP